MFEWKKKIIFDSFPLKHIYITWFVIKELRQGWLLRGKWEETCRKIESYCHHIAGSNFAHFKNFIFPPIFLKYPLALLGSLQDLLKVVKTIWMFLKYFFVIFVSLMGGNSLSVEVQRKVTIETMCNFCNPCEKATKMFLNLLIL